MLSRWRDLLPGVVLLVMVVALYWITTTFSTVPALFAQGMQATAMPRLILGVMAVLTLVMLYQGYGHVEEDKPVISWRMWVTAGLLLAAFLLFEILGLTLTMALTCLLIPLLWGERRLGRIVIYAVCTPVMIYLLFTYALQLRLPQGILSPWLS
ncbi:MAG: tripartite tricarboxylate transporter TctB family protein [Salinicola sp.]|uniref:Tripartite tricarboxylate transporter TctB family protein n=1 Tax=Salinicola lusitanus TaxID=1949085 RepID=A0ABZ3CUQ9_9GAMM|nr:tripartite tricarboxylate transporter TctB family protein [Salinicola sp.]NRB54414.1 tripartite tricarboxylate transporter TctB family protein [Salinicola sp.]